MSHEGAVHRRGRAGRREKGGGQGGGLGWAGLGFQERVLRQIVQLYKQPFRLDSEGPQS